MNKFPLITVATVVLNGGKTLEDTILSVINQTYQNIEYVIIDGGSTDNTNEIIKKYSERITYWWSEHDDGLYCAMNKALDFASGDFVIFMGADDVFYAKNTLDNCVEKMCCEANVYYGDVVLKTTGKRHGEKFSAMKLLNYNSSICHQSIFYPKRIYKKYKYNVKYRVLADKEYNMKIWSKVKFCYIAEIIAVYNNTGFSSKTRDEKFCEDYELIVKDCFNLFYFVVFKFLIAFNKLRDTVRLRSRIFVFIHKYAKLLK
jgi:glycosyltransferase involved in cell wall biosynthesis